jgi:hypothetical protein
MNRYDIALGKPVIQVSLCDSPTVPDTKTLLEKIEKFGAENYPKLKERLMLKALGVPVAVLDSDPLTLSYGSTLNVNSTPNSEVNRFFDLWQEYQYFKFRTEQALQLPNLDKSP